MWEELGLLHSWLVEWLIGTCESVWFGSRCAVLTTIDNGGGGGGSDGSSKLLIVTGVVAVLFLLLLLLLYSSSLSSMENDVELTHTHTNTQLHCSVCNRRGYFLAAAAAAVVVLVINPP